MKGGLLHAKKPIFAPGEAGAPASLNQTALKTLIPRMLIGLSELLIKFGF